jgi:hypothetical protein
MIPITQTTPKVQNGANNGTPAPRVMANPFAKAAKNHLETGQSQTITLSAAQQNLQPFVVPAYGYLREVLLVVTATTAGNSATVAFAADAPWNVIRSMVLQDSGGAQLFQMGGYASFLQMKWGGYAFNGNLALDTRFFSAVTGAGATGGSFQFVIPITQVFMRDGVGALPNMDASSAYQLFVTSDVLANVYSTAPTAAPSIVFSLQEVAYTNPPKMDLFNRPNITVPPGISAEGSSVQYWSSNIFPGLGTGLNTITINRVGNNIRGHILVFRTAAGVRADLINATDQVTFDWDGNNRYLIPRATLDYLAFREYGYSTDLGVVPLMNIFDPDGRAGNELGQEYMQTVSGTRLILRFNLNAAGSCEVLTNDVVLPLFLR